MYAAEPLIRLARLYAQHEGLNLSQLGSRAGHQKLFTALESGKTCRIDVAERAWKWFAANWPAGLVWPPDIERPHCRPREVA